MTSNHTNIQTPHPRSLTDLKSFRSQSQSFSLVPKPTRRYLKKLTLKYMCCPDCESKNITFYGKSSIGTQKYHCKSCNYQFVAQFEAFFPRRGRREMFEQEFMENLAATGFDTGRGKKKYWKGARLETLQMIESQQIRITANKMIKNLEIISDSNYRALLEYILHEAYIKARSY